LLDLADMGMSSLIFNASKEGTSCGLCGARP